MPAGIEIKNESGYLQITDAFKNFVMIDKGTVSLGGAAWSPSLGGGTYTYGAHAQISIPNTTGYPPLLAFRCTVYIAIFRTRLVSGNWVFDIVSQLGGNYSTTIEWFAFSETPNVAPDSFGVEIRNAAGELAFHSSYKQLVVGDYQSQAAGHSGSVTLPSGRTLALAILSPLWEWSPQVPAGTWQQFLLGSAIRTTGVRTGNLIPNLQYGQVYQPANFGWGGGTSGQWSLLALDVTNY